MAQVDSKFVDLTKTMKADITATIEQHFAEQNKGIDKKIADVSTKMDGQIASLRAEIDKNKSLCVDFSNGQCISWDYRSQESPIASP